MISVKIGPRGDQESIRRKTPIDSRPLLRTAAPRRRNFGKPETRRGRSCGRGHDHSTAVGVMVSGNRVGGKVDFHSRHVDAKVEITVRRSTPAPSFPPTPACDLSWDLRGVDGRGRRAWRRSLCLLPISASPLSDAQAQVAHINLENFPSAQVAAMGG